MVMALFGVGLGSKHKQAEPFAGKKENILQKKGLVSRKDSQTLVDTRLFMNGMNFLTLGVEKSTANSVTINLKSSFWKSLVNILKELSWRTKGE